LAHLSKSDDDNFTFSVHGISSPLSRLSRVPIKVFWSVVSTKASADQVSLAVAEFTESVRHSPQLFRLERECDEIDQKHQHNNQAQRPTAGG
jgi:hypothetical protein